MENKFNILSKPLAIFIAGVLIGGAVVVCVYFYKDKGALIGSEIVSSQEAGEKAINFINQNILQGKAVASLLGIVEENGLYKMKFSIQGQEIESYLTRDGKILFPEAVKLTEAVKPVAEKGSTIGDFVISDEEICKENEKPVVYFFGSESCLHCKWEAPIIEEVANKFKDNIIFKERIDSQENIDVFQRYSTGGVPTLVLGCKYYRVGSGEQAGKETETKNLTALICKLTGGQPNGVCEEVKDLISQITD